MFGLLLDYIFKKIFCVELPERDSFDNKANFTQGQICMMDFVTSLLSGSFFLHSRDLSGYLTFIRSGELETGGVGYTVQQLGKCEKTCSEIIC